MLVLWSSAALSGQTQTVQTPPPTSQQSTSADPQTTGQSTSVATGQSPPAGQSTTAPAPPPANAVQPSDDDRLPSLPEPDYRLVNLATTLRLPTHKLDFELTHRFSSNLEDGTFSQNLSNLFGLDQGAAIGLELRYAVARHVEVAIFRTNIDKTIQFYSKLDLIHQDANRPVGLSALVSVEGTENFHANHQPGISLIVSRAVATRLALYVEPTWVGRTGIEAGINQGTSFIGLGARVRVRQRTYLVGEVSPRVMGYAPGQAEFAFGLEERVGGHVFQLNFSNTSSTTLGQVARGGFPHTISLGFNLARKFF